MKEIKKYIVSNRVIENIPLVKSDKADLSKYQKAGKSTTWTVIYNNELNYLLQFNYNQNKFSGFIVEPYMLFLDYSKSISNEIEIIKKDLTNRVVNEFELNHAFKLKLIDQKTFDKFLILRINFVVFLIMSLESFLNFYIPIVVDGIEKLEIEEKYSIKRKLKEILPKLIKIPSYNEYDSKCSEILRLVTLRNEFVHLKTQSFSVKFDKYLSDFEAIIRMDVNKEFSIVSNFIDFVSKSEKNKIH